MMKSSLLTLFLYLILTMNNKKIIWGSEDKVKKYNKEVNQILNCLDDIEEGYGLSLVTDESSFLDFDLTKEQLDQLSFELQQEIKEDDLIVDVAKKINEWYEQIAENYSQ